MPATPDPLDGWLLPTHSLLVLEEAVAPGAVSQGSSGLLLLGSEGEVWGRVQGPVAAELRAQLRGAAAPASPLLKALTSRVPGLGAALQEPALPISPATALRREGWGQLFVELTARCNERCVHCYVESSPERTETLSRATVEAVVAEAAELGFQLVQFTGGEALLCPFLEDVATLALELGTPGVEVYTNGVLLDERRYAGLRRVGVSFAFSLYARDPQRHDAITRLAGSHARTLTAIRRAIGGGSPVRVGVVAVSAEDEAHALQAVALARELGVAHVTLDVARAVGRGDHAGRPAPLDPTQEPIALGGHSTQRGGKAAVLADGSVAPCIFAREWVLGHVGPEGGLRASLERPALGLASCERARSALSSGAAALACAECRVGASLLRPPTKSTLPRAKVSG